MIRAPEPSTVKLACLGFVLHALLAACATTSTTTDLGPSERRVLTEPQALLVLEAALDRAGVGHGRDLALDLGSGPQLVADLRFGSPAFAIEWVSTSDRDLHGDALPRGVDNGPLRIVTARDAAGDAVQVLVLDQNAYAFEANPQRVQRGAPSIVEAEERVRRDALDFAEYVRGQGALER